MYTTHAEAVRACPCRAVIRGFHHYIFLHFHSADSCTNPQDGMHHYPCYLPPTSRAPIFTVLANGPLALAEQ